MQIYLARNNQQAGPYSLEQLNQMLASQQVLLTDLVWHQGMSEWKALGELTQGKLVYEPAGHVPEARPNPAPFGEQNSSINLNKSAQPNNTPTQYASIPSRALAKIVDLILWLPATMFLTAFFSPEAEKQFAALAEQFMNAALGANAEQTAAQAIQQQMMSLIPTEAWVSMVIYLVIMLAVQIFFLAKSGQSIGKKLTKIKIVDAETAEKVSLMRAFTLRSAVFILLNFMLAPLITLVDYLFALGKKRQTLHDKLAKTKVIKE